MVRTWLAVAVAAGVAVAALVDGVRSDRSQAAGPASEQRAAPDARALTGPDVPAGGALPGQLVLARLGDCRLALVTLAGPQLSRPGPETGCALWASPSGRYAVAAAGGRSAGAGRLALLRLGAQPSRVAELAGARDAPTWAASGDVLAYCTQAGFTVVEDLRANARRPVRGCHPRFAADGSLLTTPVPARSSLLRNGALLRSQAALARVLPAGRRSGLEVLDYDATRSGLLAVVVRAAGLPALELWQGERPLGAFAFPVPAGGELDPIVRFSPDGQQLALAGRTSDGRRPVTFFDLRLRTTTLSLDDQRGYAWSPDGAWLAVATDDGVTVYGRAGGEAIYRLPLDVAALGWTAGAR